MALMTMIKYVKEYGNYTFMERPMSDVDSLVLCQFSYLKFDGMVPTLHENKPSVSMQQLAAHAQYEDLFRDVRYEKEGKDFYLRIIIDKPEGIDINDCETVNNAINDILDEADYINNRHRYGNEKKPDAFESGESVHLNGYQALWYSRIRKLDSDFMRTQRQRKVISAIDKTNWLAGDQTYESVP